jgi:bifunctional DNA-binding transcriptional regulator/antitoxin component of YhaV-PrlF toxin-antitoxin module
VVKIEDISLLIDQLEQLLSDSRRIPLTSGALVDRDQCLLIIDQMRVTIPQQIAEARRIQGERDQVIARAEQEAQMIVERAQEEAAQVLNERGLLKEVHDRSTALAEETRRQAEETMRGADGYAIRVLGELEDQLIALQTTIRNGLEILQQDSRIARLTAEDALQDSSAESDPEAE